MLSSSRYDGTSDSSMRAKDIRRKMHVSCPRSSRAAIISAAVTALCSRELVSRNYFGKYRLQNLAELYQGRQGKIPSWRAFRRRPPRVYRKCLPGNTTTPTILIPATDSPPTYLPPPVFVAISIEFCCSEVVFAHIVTVPVSRSVAREQDRTVVRQHYSSPGLNPRTDTLGTEVATATWPLTQREQGNGVGTAGGSHSRAEEYTRASALANAKQNAAETLKGGTPVLTQSGGGKQQHRPTQDIKSAS